MTVEIYQRRNCGGTVSLAVAGLNADDRGIAVGETAAVFKTWGAATTSLAVWHRDLPVDIAELLVELRLDDITGWRRSFDAATAAPLIAEAMSTSGFSHPALERFLATDMALLARLFAASTGTSHIEARLDIIRDNACRRFHTDACPARLAVTYLGPGTVWVPHGHGEQALAEQESYSGPRLEIPAFSAGLFVGEQAGRIGLVHRSPRIAGTGRARLFFCVNGARH